MAGSQLNQAKELLAFELTKLIHSEEEAIKARYYQGFVFQRDASNMPTTELSTGIWRTAPSIYLLSAEERTVPQQIRGPQGNVGRY